MPTGESVWRRDGARHVTVDIGPNMGVLATVPIKSISSPIVW